MSTTIKIRVAGPPDWDEIAGVFSASLASMEFLPRIHTVEEERWFITNVIARECTVHVSEIDGRVAGFLALQPHDAGVAEIRLLHMHPAFFGLGAGSALLKEAISADTGPIELWCFQANDGARRFYERHGFRAAELSDGSRNEEKLPDIRYVREASSSGP